SGGSVDTMPARRRRPLFKSAVSWPRGLKAAARTEAADLYRPCRQKPKVRPMAWDFETDPEFQEKLDWIDRFIDEKVEPIDLVFPGLAYHPLEGKLRDLVDPLKQEVREQGLWACHLGPDL